LTSTAEETREKCYGAEVQEAEWSGKIKSGPQLSWAVRTDVGNASSGPWKGPHSFGKALHDTVLWGEQGTKAGEQKFVPVSLSGQLLWNQERQSISLSLQRWTASLGNEVILALYHS